MGIASGSGALYAPSAGRGAVVLLATLVLLLLSPGARAGDPELAKFLVKQGRTAFDKGLYDDALAKFQKARDEDPEALEPLWWAGQANEKKGTPVAAIEAYRALLEAFDTRKRAGKATADDGTFQKKAQGRLDALAVGDAAFNALQEGYVARLLAFAREQATKDRSIAERAVRRALDVAPDDPAALDLLKTLTGKAAAGDGSDAKGDSASGKDPPPSKDGPPSKHLKAWHDFLAEKAFQSDDISYDDAGLMTVDRTGPSGTIVWMDGHPTWGPSYVIEAEGRVVEPHDTGWLWGIVFARSDDDMLAAIVKKSDLILTAGKLSGGHDDLETVRIAPVALNAWRRLAVDVAGTRVAVWLDGKKVIDREISDREGLSGEVGSWQQSVKADYRTWRLAERGE